MKSIRHTHTLFYYDGPQVFEARDAIGGHYVAVMLEPDLHSETVTPSDGPGDRYLVAGVAPERLRQFRTGAIDLRSLLVGSEDHERYMATARNGVENALALQRLAIPLIESGYLPDEGFLLHDHASEGVLREARERNNLVVEIIAEPPEASAGHRIRANTLAGMLHHVQAMVRHAYSKARPRPWHAQSSTNRCPSRCRRSCRSGVVSGRTRGGHHARFARRQ